jgi:hypothetical protein
MAIVTTDNKHYANIASKIREKCGTDAQYKPADMPDGIEQVYDAGYDKARSDAGDTYTAGFTDGSNYATDAFWDQRQNFGNCVTYIHGFREWGGEYIRPKYVVRPVATSVNSMFRDATKLKIVEAKYFDLLNAMTSPTNAANGNQRVFQGCTALETIENIGLPASYYDATFNGCSALKTIAQLRFSQTGAGTKISNNCFENCVSLETIQEIVGVIEVSINFQWCPLTAETAKKIINALENYAGTGNEFSCKVMFSDSTIALLNAEGNTSPSGTSWVEYIAEIGWDS